MASPGDPRLGCDGYTSGMCVCVCVCVCVRERGRNRSACQEGEMKKSKRLACDLSRARPGKRRHCQPGRDAIDTCGTGTSTDDGRTGQFHTHAIREGAAVKEGRGRREGRDVGGSRKVDDVHQREREGERGRGRGGETQQRAGRVQLAAQHPRMSCRWVDIRSIDGDGGTVHELNADKRERPSGQHNCRGLSCLPAVMKNTCKSLGK
jgi:hypothetical protein